MLVFKFLHIASMFAAVTLIFGSIVFLDLLARRADVVAYLRLDALVKRTDMVAIGLFLMGLVFGFATALTGAVDLTASWLVVAYVLVAGIFVEGIFITIPRYNHIRHIATNSDPAVAGDAIAGLVRDPRHVGLVMIVTLLWLGVVYVMVVKPTLF
ncbi:MAG: hypothetical protein M3153_01875 [Chloroflexota bacterium]|nr:hypothetical protein [Chloroflexota bacterium]